MQGVFNSKVGEFYDINRVVTYTTFKEDAWIEKEWNVL